MLHSRTTGRIIVLVAVAVGLWMAFFQSAPTTTTNEPVAQTADLRATIQNSLLIDPRTASLPESDVDALVAALTQEAQNKGMTVSDIVWRPQNAEGYVADNVSLQAEGMCGASVFCRASEVLGFVGPGSSMPLVLGVTSMLLVWICAEMLHRRPRPEKPLWDKPFA